MEAITGAASKIHSLLFAAKPQESSVFNLTD